MDRTAAVVIILGIFLGSVYSLASHSREIRLSPLSGGENDALEIRSSSKLQGASDYGSLESPPPPQAPTQDDAMADLGQGKEDISEPYRNEVENAGAIWTVAAGEILSLGTSTDGVTATYPDIEKRYFYEDFVTVMVVLTDDSETQEVADQLGAVIADEFTLKILIFLPEGSEQALDALVNEGKISSYEIGGWGTGLGKA